MAARKVIVTGTRLSLPIAKNDFSAFAERVFLIGGTRQGSPGRTDYVVVSGTPGKFVGGIEALQEYSFEIFGLNGKDSVRYDEKIVFEGLPIFEVAVTTKGEHNHPADHARRLNDLLADIDERVSEFQKRMNLSCLANPAYRERAERADLVYGRPTVPHFNVK